MQEAIFLALRPLQEQLARLNLSSAPLLAATEQKEQKQQLQLLQNETKAASLSSTGAQSQYRCLASIHMQLSNAEFLLTRPSPDDAIYQSISPIKEPISGAVSTAKERIQLIFQADSDPKVGWKVITLYEEKQHLPDSD